MWCHRYADLWERVKLEERGDIKTLEKAIVDIHIFLRAAHVFFVSFWLRWVFVAARRLSLVAASRGYSSHCGGFSCCEARALGTRASAIAARGLSSCGSRALEHRLSSCGARA